MYLRIQGYHVLCGITRPLVQYYLRIPGNLAPLAGVYKAVYTLPTQLSAYEYVHMQESSD